MKEFGRCVMASVYLRRFLMRIGSKFKKVVNRMNFGSQESKNKTNRTASVFPLYFLSRDPKKKKKRMEEKGLKSYWKSKAIEWKSRNSSWKVKVKLKFRSVTQEYFII